MLLKQIADLTEKTMEQAKGRQTVEAQSEVLVEVKVATTKST